MALSLSALITERDTIVTEMARLTKTPGAGGSSIPSDLNDRINALDKRLEQVNKLIGLANISVTAKVKGYD